MGRFKKFVAITGVSVACLLGTYGIAVAPHQLWAAAESADGLLDRADKLSWTNRWAEAQPVYAKAAMLFRRYGEGSKALYAEVSEIPPDESTSVVTHILSLNHDLLLPERARTRRRATRLNLSLINTDDRATRAAIDSAIYNTELFEKPTQLDIVRESITHPVKLAKLQKSLGSQALLV